MIGIYKVKNGQPFLHQSRIGEILEIRIHKILDRGKIHD
jgi:hypothetical protein